MSTKLLGKTLDIHGGGLDLQFPHHENELAQSESYNDAPFVRFWMHNGLMRIHSQSSKLKGEAAGQPEKMSKSLGNEIVVSKLFERHQPETIRFFLLATHYRRPIDYSEERLEEIRRGLDAFYRFFERFERIAKKRFFDLQAPATRRPFEPNTPGSEFIAEIVGLWEKFLGHMDDDFNTGGAIGVLYELLTALNRFADQRKLEEGASSPEDLRAFERGVLVLREFSQILGVFEKAPAKKAESDDGLTAGLMQLLIDLRNEARKTKNFAVADQIRKRLAELKVTIEDRPAGSIWRVDR